MSSSLRDELASLRIERRPSQYSMKPDASPRIGRGWGMRILSAILWLIPIGLLGGAGVLGYNQYSQFKPKVEVKLDIVQRKSAAEAIRLFEAKGYIRAQYRASVGTKIPGRIEQLLVQEGTFVNEGDLIAVLEHNEIDAMLENRQASKMRAEAELLEARAELANKERKAARQSRLFTNNNSAAEEAELALTERDKARARLGALEAQIRMIDAQIHETQEALRNMEIRAPFSGTVLTKTAEKGETINTMSLGAGGGRSALVEIADLTRLEVETEVAEKEIGRVAVGQLALVEAPAVPDKAFPAHVREVIKMGDRAKATVKVYVAIDDAESGLFPELLANKVSFLPKTLDRSELDALAEFHLYLNPAALVTEGGKAYAWVLEAGNKVRKKPIETREVFRKIEVVSGLSAGDRVVLNPPEGLAEGQVVSTSSD
ncbi:MAG: efflux RND transporter periplasmic adaptor subunit [Isosphaeraceae bacterium]